MNKTLPHILISLILMLVGNACGEDEDHSQAYPDCPDFSSGTAPSCACEDGYLGSITWDATLEAYSGECVTPLDLAIRTGDVRHLTEIETALSEGLGDLATAKAGSEEILRGIYRTGPIEYNPNP